MLRRCDSGAYIHEIGAKSYQQHGESSLFLWFITRIFRDLVLTTSSRSLQRSLKVVRPSKGKLKSNVIS